MIESLYVKPKDPQKKENTIANTFNGVIAGSIVGDAAAMVVPVREDEFIAAEKKLSEDVTPKAGKSLRSFAESMIKRDRAMSWGGLGMIVCGGAALIYSLVKNADNNKEK